MQADTGYDTTRFQALRRVLGALNERAHADGLVAVRDGVVLSPEKRTRAARKAAAAKKGPKGPDRSPAAAAGLLALLRRRDGDQSPDVPGTAFTEDGVMRLLSRLRERRSSRGTGAWLRFLKGAERHLGHPVPFGLRTVQGVGLERLQVFARQLESIETGGWARFLESREVRRRKVVATLPLTRDAVKAEPAKSRRKGKSR